MKFIDEANIRVEAGKGGNGSCSFRREKFVPFGGPDGGDGGNGGSVYLRAAPGINTLAGFRVERTFKGGTGTAGSGNDCPGAAGEDLYVPAPIGTIVTDSDTGEHRSVVMADIPGLIEGAAEGAGLGIRFLRHLQRTRVLLHLVDIAPPDPDADPVKDARAIVTELKKFSKDLTEKPRWLVLNKI